MSQQAGLGVQAASERGSKRVKAPGVRSAIGQGMAESDINFGVITVFRIELERRDRQTQYDAICTSMTKVKNVAGLSRKRKVLHGKGQGLWSGLWHMRHNSASKAVWRRMMAALKNVR
jgi:hypothetical protein